ncbi:hypothetical protein [Ammoniphilus resinae]|uniref:Uncharacterized protein n=1 Tax=Ammoniphilus resinae TaxID=861532 RepID=A0ABS4GIM1_9BACL|nr:hypothetical protein [Ammoniphilus resinae]MBP1930105.1 hypothetical protein [Ammoniphilus resinae]
MFSDDDDNIAIIGLWIIAIGFVVLAIDKTSRLNNDQNQEQIQLPPSDQQSTPQPEDEQFKQIQMQLQQLKNGISELKKNPKLNNK